jgi:hypothetical protein
VNKITHGDAAYHAEQPQDQENYKNRPKHFNLPPFVNHALTFVGTKAIVGDLSNAHAARAFSSFFNLREAIRFTCV